MQNSPRELYMSESEGFLADIPLEGGAQKIEDALDSVDKVLQEDKPAESPTEKLDLPDESILKKNSAWEEMRTAREEAEAKARDLEARLSALEKEDIEVEKSDFVKSLVGENEEVEEKWAKEKISLKEELKQELVREQLDAQRREQEQKEYWAKWTDERLSEVEKEFKVDFKSDESKRNELSKIMLDYSPTDEQGNLDYRKGMKILNELSKVKEVEETQKTQMKKNVADATVSKETTAKQNKDYVTTNDIRGKDWRSWADKDY